MAYRSGPTSYLIRDTPKKQIAHDDEEEDESERIEVEDDGSEFVRGGSSEGRRGREMMEGLGEYRKKYTFTTRKAATLYHCHECNKTFKHPSKIAEHLRKHTKERPFLCEVCGAQFTQGGSLKVHLRAHLGQLPYKCSYCDRHFATPYNQRVHEAVHMRGGRLHRDLSNRLMEKEGEARLKMQSAAAALAANQKRRAEVGDQMYECCVDNCGYRHTMKEMVENHVISEHPPEMWETEEMEGEEVIEGEEGAEYQDYTFYEYVEGDSLMEDQEVVVMTEEEAAAAAAAEDREQEHLSSPSPSLSSRLPLHSSMGVHSTVFHPSTSSGSALMIEADEHIDDDGMRKTITDDGRTKRLRMLTLGRSGGGMVKDEMYPDETYSPPLASYEVEVMTSREETAAAAAAAAAVSSTMEDDDEEDPQPVFAEMTRAQLIDEMEPEDDGSNRIRILADLRPPAKGRRPQHKWEIEGMEADVDRGFLEEVMPQPPRSHQGNRCRKKRQGLPAGLPMQSRNLDWIIDAVAMGQDVDTMSPHNRRKPQIHTCEFCGKTDKYPSKIEAHRRTHTGEKPYKCEFCGMGFAQKTPLRMHIRRHLNDRSFGCDYEGCNAKFISQALLNAHTSNRHENTRRSVGGNRNVLCESTRFVCMKGCGRWFATGINQRHHELKCNHAIPRTTVNTDYMQEAGYDEAPEDGDGPYLEEEEVEVDEDDDYEGHEGIHLEDDRDDMDSIPPAYRL